MHILIVDDDADLVDLIGYALRRAGYTVSGALTAAEARVAILNRRVDLVILDVNLGDVDGIVVLQYLRRVSKSPVLVLTTHSDEREAVRFLDAGADDFVTKQFRPKELVARVRALLRRSMWAREAAVAPRLLQVGTLRIDADGYSASIGGQPLHLTPTEFKLLHCLALNAGRVMSNSEIVLQVWGDEHSRRTASDLVRVNMMRLRRKLGRDPGGVPALKTIVGVGYVLLPPSDASEAS